MRRIVVVRAHVWTSLMACRVWHMALTDLASCPLIGATVGLGGVLTAGKTKPVMCSERFHLPELCVDAV